MNEDQMRSFIDVVDTGSINKAARRQHLSVPSLAQRVTSLEHELGFELLERGPRGTVATEAGRCLYHAFAEALAITDAAKERGRALAARRARLVSIGIWGRAAKFMTDAIEELAARDETLRVDFVSTSLMTAAKGFEDRAFDIFYSCRCTSSSTYASSRPATPSNGLKPYPWTISHAPSSTRAPTIAKSPSCSPTPRFSRPIP